MGSFTEGELEVMRALWAHGEMKPAEVRAAFPRPVKDSAVRSHLTILLGKGHLTRRKVGKAYYYRARTPRESAFRQRLRALVDGFCEGSTEALLFRLIKEEQLSEEELVEVKRLADGADEWPGRRGGGGS